MGKTTSRFSVSPDKMGPMLFCLFFVACFFKVDAQQTIFFSDSCNNATGWTLQGGVPYPGTGEYTAWRVSSTGTCIIDGSSLAINAWNAPGASGWSCNYLKDYDALDIKAFKQVDARGYNTLELEFDWYCKGEYISWNNSAWDYGQVGYSTNGGSTFTWINSGGINNLGKYCASTAITRNAKISLPGLLDNTQFLLAFRWVNDESSGTNPGFIVDNIKVMGQADEVVTYTEQTIFSDACSNTTGWTTQGGTPYPGTGEYTAWRISSIGTCAIDGSALAINTWNGSAPNGWSCDYLFDYGNLDIKAYKQVSAAGYEDLKLKFDWYCNGEFYTWNNTSWDYGQVGYSTDGGTTFTWLTTGGTNAGRYFGSTAITRDQTITLPAGLNNTTFLIGFRWINDESNGNAPGFIVDNIRVTGLSIGRANGIPPNTVSICTGDDTRNWTNTSLFDVNGEKISESRTYTDYLGRPTQSQSRIFADNNTIAVQTLYDAYGRAVLTTLPAPVSQDEICFKTDFIANASGAAYTFSDFDLPISTGAAGEVNNPKPVGASFLGLYYSNINLSSPYVPASKFPYTRVEFDDNNLGAVKRIALAGESLRMGSGHESYTVTMPLANELRYLDPIYASCKGMKTITADANGIEAVILMDLDGKTIATCLSGQENGANVRTLSVTSKIKTGSTDQKFIDIHLPEGCESSLTIDNSGNAITYNILNLKTGSYVLFSGNVNYTGTAPDLDPGYYRIIYKQGTAPAEINVSYNANYYNFTLNYYNKANQLTAVVPPLGIHNAYDPNGAGQPNHQMKTTYEYNSLGWLISKNSPDEGLVECVYRKDGNLRFSQNAKQKNGTANRLYQRYSYFNYDELGRVVEVGEYDPTLPSLGTNYYFENYAENLANPISNSIHGDAILESINTSTVKLDVGRCRFNTYTYYDLPAPGFSNNGLASSYTQDFLRGRVSGTANAADSTWYSYDDQGRLKWMVQRINNMPQIHTQTTKTVHYTYDFNGNVTEVAYQKDVIAEKFIHYYTYDADKRLIKVHTSTDGIKKDEQAEYYYYKHGPLKRVDVANKLQGIDYVYTINGWLKSINAPELNDRDPGKDGTKYSVSHAPPDLFGMTLDYFSGDYKRMNTFVQTYENPVCPSPPCDPDYSKDLYNGLIKAQRWNIAVPPNITTVEYSGEELMYAYLYDKRYQLTAATFGTTTAGMRNSNISPEPGEYMGPVFFAGSNYGLSGISYDANGNLKNLNRNGFASTGNGPMDQLTYDYISNTNQLHKVVDGVTDSPAFGDRNFKYGQGNDNYSYDDIGQLAGDISNSKYFDYDPFGNVIGVYTNETMSEPLAKFVYDDRGFRIKKTNYSTSTHTELTDYFYVRDASGNLLSVYEKNYATPSVATQTELNLFGASRLGTFNRTNPAKYIYELADHLGNVKTTFSKVTDLDAATGFSGLGPEDYRFTFNTAIDEALDITGGAGSSVKLAYPTAQYGTAIHIPVTQGQVINTSIFSRHTSSSGTPLSALAFDLMDASGSIINGIWGIIDGPANQWTENIHSFDITDNVPGMKLVIYPMNIDESGDPLWFDNFTITITPNTAGEGGWSKPSQLSLTDYYPHGGIMPLRFFSNSLYRNDYQGQFAEKDAETGLNSFELRNYDAKLGRWFAPDPYGQYHSPYLSMNNNPLNFIDPDGGFSPGPKSFWGIVVDIFTDSKYMHRGRVGTIAGPITRTFSFSIAKQVGAGLINDLAANERIIQNHTKDIGDFNNGNETVNEWVRRMNENKNYRSIKTNYKATTISAYNNDFPGTDTKYDFNLNGQEKSIQKNTNRGRYITESFNVNTQPGHLATVTMTKFADGNGRADACQYFKMDVRVRLDIQVVQPRFNLFKVKF